MGQICFFFPYGGILLTQTSFHEELSFLHDSVIPALLWIKFVSGLSILFYQFISLY